MRPEPSVSKLVDHARGGRAWAPSLSIWVPILSKIALAAGIAAVLAVIGTRAAAHAWNATDGRGPVEEPSLGSTAMSSSGAASTNAIASRAGAGDTYGALRDAGAPREPASAVKPARERAGEANPQTPSQHAASVPSTDPPEADATASPETEGPSALLPDGRVVLNRATEEQLIRLPGIGPARARAILALRDRMGRFRSVDQLRRVKGIGRKTLQRLAPLIVVDAPVAKPGGKETG